MVSHRLSPPLERPTGPRRLHRRLWSMVVRGRFPFYNMSFVQEAPVQLRCLCRRRRRRSVMIMYASRKTFDLFPRKTSGPCDFQPQKGIQRSGRPLTPALMQSCSSQASCFDNVSPVPLSPVDSRATKYFVHLVGGPPASFLASGSRRLVGVSAWGRRLRTQQASPKRSPSMCGAGELHLCLGGVTQPFRVRALRAFLVACGCSISS